MTIVELYQQIVALQDSEGLTINDEVRLITLDAETGISAAEVHYHANGQKYLTLHSDEPGE